MEIKITGCSTCPFVVKSGIYKCFLKDSIKGFVDIRDNNQTKLRKHPPINCPIKLSGNQITVKI